MNLELPDVQAGFRKGRGTRDQNANIRCIIEKAREFQKNFYFCFIDYALLTMPKPLTVSVSSVQLLCRVQLLATPWTAAGQASLSITNCQSLFKLMSIE